MSHPACVGFKWRSISASLVSPFVSETCKVVKSLATNIHTRKSAELSTSFFNIIHQTKFCLNLHRVPALSVKMEHRQKLRQSSEHLFEVESMPSLFLFTRTDLIQTRERFVCVTSKKGHNIFEDTGKTEGSKTLFYF